MLPGEVYQSNMSGNASIEDEIFACLDTWMYNSDTRADNCMPDCSNPNPFLEKEQLYDPGMMSETEFLEKAPVTENMTEETEDYVRFTDFEKRNTSASPCDTISLGDGVFNSTSSTSTAVAHEEASISSIQPGPATDKAPSVSSKTESNHSLTTDLKSILQDICHRPDLIDQLIDSLQKDIQRDSIMIKFITLFHYKITGDINGNQKLNSVSESGSTFGDSDRLHRLFQHGLNAQNSCETSTSNNINNNSFLVLDTAAPSSPQFESTFDR